MEDPTVSRVPDDGRVRSQPNGERGTQAAAQCRAVSHLARALAGVMDDRAAILESAPTVLAERWGQHTAELMEMLGDVLNGMDAVDPDEDAWMNPVFKRAHEFWPPTPRDPPAASDISREDQ